MMIAANARVVFMTAPNAETASDIVRTLIEEGVIACGNIIPGLTSIYRWQGVIEQTAEVMVLMKTVAEQIERLERRVRELHPYEVPELLAIRVSEGNQPYLTWVADNTTPGV